MRKEKRIVLSILILFALAIYSCEPPESFEQRRQAAKALLLNKCDVIVNASTEFVREKHPFAAVMADAVISSKCDCISDSLAVQLANEYTLQQIDEMNQQPIESLTTILDKLMNRHDGMVMDCVQQW